MKTRIIGRENEISFLARSLSNRGKVRSVLITGPPGMGKTSLLQHMAGKILKEEKNYLILSPRVEDLTDPLSLCSSLTRNTSVSGGIDRSSLTDFAREWGSQAVALAREGAVSTDSSKWDEKLAEIWVRALENALGSGNPLMQGVTPVLILDDLDLFPKGSLDWLAGPFNQAIRKSPIFRRARFVFSAKNPTSAIQNFFDRFGFDKVRSIDLNPLTPSQCEKLASLHHFQSMAGRELFEASGGIPLKLLNIFQKSTNLIKPKSSVMTEPQKKELPHFSDFSEEEFNHLLFASYLNRINRYSLEFLCNPRDASFCYNWLKRKKKIARQEPDGDLILNPELREKLQEFHRQDKPEESERLNVVATIVDAFISVFPNPNLHWIPIHLQALDSFSKDLCRKLFSQTETPDVLSFLENHEDQFNRNGKVFSLTSENKLLTQRFMEIGGGECKEGFVDKAKAQWELDCEAAADKKGKMKQEQMSLAEEAVDLDGQIESLNALKQKILDDFKNPAKTKALREYSFTSSKFLIVFGLCTIVASLSSDSFGTTYAACGIALTLFGFFWPNVEVKKPAGFAAGPGAGPRLAIETQQRSLDHRINGLTSRASSIKSNLHNISDELESLNQGMDVPYVTEASTP